ncbi:MAG: hypothetical protein LBS10_07795 [Gracilibacteraceae bacterium]|jgi:hypothetical protein|nr:hypothetical protein [Gracilibacteraceae bacterium]
MSIFQPQCRLCQKPLPPERRWRQVCDACGGVYEELLAEIRAADAAPSRGADPRNGYLRCVGALAAVERLELYRQAGVSVPGQTEPETMRRHFADRARSFAIAVAAGNEKLPYGQKTGLPPLRRGEREAGVPVGRTTGCRACGAVGPVNSAGFCHACIRRATSFSPREMDEYARGHSIRGLSEYEWRTATLDWKLERSKQRK